MPAGLPVEVRAKVPSRYYRVPRYFFTVLTVAHNRWYRPTLLHTLNSVNSGQGLVVILLYDMVCSVMCFRSFSRKRNIYTLVTVTVYSYK